MRSDILNDNSGVSNVNKKFEIIASARTLTADDSGKVFGIDQDSGAYEITLPLAATAGIPDNESISSTGLSVDLERGH